MRNAMHRNFTAAAERVVHSGYPSTAVRVGPLRLIDAGRASHPCLNAAIVATEAVIDDLAVAERWFADRGSTCVFRLRSDRDAELISALEARGYSVTRREPAMCLDTPRAPRYEGPLAVAEIASVRELERHARYLDDGNELAHALARKVLSIPGFSVYLGYVDDRPIATASGLTSSSIVGIYAVRVHEDQRRRGFGTAITWAAIAGGLRRGATSAWLGSSPMSHGIYERMGFTTRYEYVMLELNE